MYSYSERRALLEVVTSTPPDQTRRMGLLVALGVLVLLLLGLRVFQAEPVTTVAVPTAVVGRWVAEGEIYGDRFFELTPTQLVLGLGDGPGRSHELKATIERKSLGIRIFELRYAAADGLQSMEVHLHPDGTMRLRNPSQVVWRRREAVP